MGKAFTPELHLKGDYLKFFRKVKGYLNAYTGTIKSFEEVEADIGEMFYTAQKDGKLLKDIIGDNEDEYILELIRTFYDVSSKKKNISFKIGNSIILASGFAFMGFTLTRSILICILAGSIGVVLNIIFFKSIKDDLDTKAIKYMKIINITTRLIFLLVLEIGILMGYTGEARKIVLWILSIGIVGAVIIQVGNYKSNKIS